jgi:hypothetical protein
MTPFIAATDYHGIEADAGAVKVFTSACKAIDPKNKHFRIMLGDLWNFESLRNGASEDERRVRITEDFVAGLNFLDTFRPNVLLLGNHDIRLWDAVERQGVRKSGWLAEYAGEMVKEFTGLAKILKIKVHPYDKKAGVFRKGGIAFAHGFGGGGRLNINMASAYGDVVFGHGHRITRDTVMKGGSPVTGYQLGCLCNKDMFYVRSDLHALKQQHGFGCGVLAGRHSTVQQIEIANGQAIVPTEYKTFK